MQNSNALTASAIALGFLSLTLSNAPIKAPRDFLSYPSEAIYQTTSVDYAVNKYSSWYSYAPELTPREEALGFFGEQLTFTDDEMITYWNALESRAINTGVNLFELL